MSTFTGDVTEFVVNTVTFQGLGKNKENSQTGREQACQAPQEIVYIPEGE